MQNSKSLVETPTVKRRLICMIYDALLLLAVEMFAVAVYLLATQNRHGTAYEHGLKFFLFLVTAAYFIHFWTDSGHTLAMKTWRIKLVKLGCARVPFRTAAARYLLAWGWFLPALAVCYAFRLTGKAEVSAAIVIGVAAWALTAFLDKDRQFLHDRLAGTRLISLPKPVKKSGTAQAS
jgi:uncharacterized RDD family membrane protein YckC